MYALSYFTPTIINELGFSTPNAQLLSVPPFAAGYISTILVGTHSDFLKHRGAICDRCSFVGLIVLYTQKSPGVAYAGTVLTTVGAFPIIIVNIVS